MSAKRNMFYFRQFGKLFKIYCQKMLLIIKSSAGKSLRWKNFPIFSSLKMKSSVITQQSHNVVKTLRQCRNFVQPIHSVETTLMSQRQNNNVASTLPQR